MKQVPTVYLIIVRRLAEKSEDNVIKTESAGVILKKVYRIPRQYVYSVLNEMEKAGLIKQKKKFIFINGKEN